MSDLRKILETFDRSNRALCLSELAADLDKPVPVLEGMLETLVGMDLLTRLTPENPCENCALQSECRILPTPERVYSRVNGSSPGDKDSGVDV